MVSFGLQIHPFTLHALLQRQRQWLRGLMPRTDMSMLLVDLCIFQSMYSIYLDETMHS